MADPLDLFAIDKIIERTNKTIEPILGTEKKHSQKKLMSIMSFREKFRILKPKLTLIFKWQDELHNDEPDEEHLQNLFRAILKHAIKDDTHELYFEHNEEGLSVNFKKMGEIYSTGTIPFLLINPFIQMIKTLCALDPMVSEVPQLEKLNFNVDSIALTASISAFPTINGERIVLKIYHPPKKINTLIPDIEKIDTLKSLLSTPGIILVSGGTLSGKTHFIYSLLNDLTPKKYGCNDFRIRCKI